MEYIHSGDNLCGKKNPDPFHHRKTETVPIYTLRASGFSNIIINKNSIKGSWSKALSTMNFCGVVEVCQDNLTDPPRMKNQAPQSKDFTATCHTQPVLGTGFWWSC